jgi:2-C-methyl-D-erythritol 2,4-cyclodiphosphate synthase
MVAMRIGIGNDIHRLVAGRALVLGGIELDSPVGLLGHSDADVVIHALIDAMLGAAGLGDIGEHFPDTDPAYQGIRSTELLTKTVELIRTAGFTVNNIDIIIMAQEPKLGPHKRAMRQRLAEMIGLDPAQVNIKAKTAEGLGPVGQRQAIAAWAAVTLV